MDSTLPETIITEAEYLHWCEICSLEDGHSTSSDYENARLVVDGTVNLSEFAGKDSVRVLPRAQIQGHLTAYNCPNLESADCQVKENALFDGSGIREVGPNFSVGGTLEARECLALTTLKGAFPHSVCLEGSGVEGLGKDFSCSGDLNVARCSSLRTLNCRVGCSLHAEGSSLRELGPDFTCTKSLHLNRCRRFNKIGKVKGPPCDVMLDGSGIEEVGRDFICAGALFLKEVSELRTLEGECHYRLDVEGAPSLNHVSFRSLDRMDFSHCPSLKTVDFKAGGDVVFHECGIREFAARATTSGSLTVRQCQHFESLSGLWPRDVTVVNSRGFSQTTSSFRCGNNLLIRHCDDFARLEGRVKGGTTLSGVCNLRKITEAFGAGEKLVLACGMMRIQSLGCRVSGDLIMANCLSPFSTLPAFQVGGDALFQECKGMENLRGRVGGSVVLKSKTGIQKIGADFECLNNLLITDCPRLEVLNCRVVGNVIIANSSLKKTGAAFSCDGKVEILDRTELKELRGRVGELIFSSSTQKLDEIKMNFHGPAPSIQLDSGKRQKSLLASKTVSNRRDGETRSVTDIPAKSERESR